MYHLQMDYYSHNLQSIKPLVSTNTFSYEYHNTIHMTCHALFANMNSLNTEIRYTKLNNNPYEQYNTVYLIHFLTHYSYDHITDDHEHYTARTTDGIIK
jgi:hypothetical protein